MLELSQGSKNHNVRIIRGELGCMLKPLQVQQQTFGRTESQGFFVFPPTLKVEHVSAPFLRHCSNLFLLLLFSCLVFQALKTLP